MKKIIFFLIVLVSSPVLAEDVKNEGPYASFSLFGVSLQDVDIEWGALTGETEFDFGFGANLALGYELGNGVRLEGELAYRTNEASSAGSDGDYNTTSLMGNAFYDFDLDGTSIKPYVGTGIGVATASDFTIPGVGEDSPDPAFAYQAMLGINYRLSDNSDIIFGYRYFTIPGDFDYKISGTSATTSYDTHNIEIGYRARF